MILDATAGNRHMWTKKDDEDIIYLDIQRELEVKPTIYADDRALPFKDRCFDTIFFDPPHLTGGGDHFYNYPRRTAEYTLKYNDRSIPRYYASEMYRNWRELMAFIYQAAKEFRRVLKDDGLLWLKWNEAEQPLNRVLALFDGWEVLMKIHVASPHQTQSSHKTYWVLLKKKKEKIEQANLLQQVFTQKLP